MAPDRNPEIVNSSPVLSISLLGNYLSPMEVAIAKHFQNLAKESAGTFPDSCQKSTLT